MKKSILLGILLVLATLVVATEPVWAEASKIEFTGTSVVAGPPVSLGECTNYPNGNQHCRGMILVAIDTMSDPRLSGTNTVVTNYNYRLAPAPVFYTGPMWGSNQIANDAGYWDYTWTGVRDEKGFLYMWAVGHGHGAYEGLRVFLKGVRESPDPAGDLLCSGYILEH
jgi:hypothetical protein